MFKKSFLVLGCLMLLGFLAFANSLDNPYMVDDHAFFESKLKNPKYIWLHFLPDKNKILHIEGESADPFYRPLATIVPMLMHLAFRDHVVGFHASNTVLFVLAGWALYLFLGFLGASGFVAFAAAVFYILHPINGVAVNYITASIFPVQIILMITSLYCFMQSLKARLWPRIALTLVSIFFYLLAAMCHETAMALPFYAVVFIWMFNRRDGIKALERENLRNNLMDVLKELFNEIKGALIKALPLFIFLGVYFIWRMSHSSLDASILSKIHKYDMNFLQYLSTWTMLLGWYLSRLFFPNGIVLIMAHQPLTQTA